MNYLELGQQVKTKYPQYQNIADEELGMKIAKKYPEYQKMIDITTTTEQPTSLGQKFLKGAEDFFVPLLGTAARVSQIGYYEELEKESMQTYTKLGEGVLNTIKDPNVSEEQKLKIIKSYRQALPRIVESHPDIQKTNEQILGEAVITGMTVMSGMLPTAQTLGQRTLTSAGMGAGYGAGEALKQGAEGKDIAKAAITGAGIGLVLAPISWYVEKGLQKVGEGLYKSLVRYSRDPQRSAKRLISQKVVGTLNTIKKALYSDVKLFENKVQGELVESKLRTTQKEIVNGAINIRKEQQPTLTRFFDENSFIDDIDRSLGKIGPYNIGKKEPTMVEVNEFRKFLDKQLGSSSFNKVFAELPDSKQNLMALRKSLENIVKTNVPSTIPIFKQYSPIMNSYKAVSYSSYKTERLMPITWFEIMGLTGGIATGYQAPIIAGMIGKRLMQSGLAASYGGAGALRLAEIIQKGASDPKIQAMLYRTLSTFVIPEKED